jgi:hypothetical protein
VTARSTIIAATAFFAAACATTQNKAAAPGPEEVHFNGYRLLVPAEQTPDAKARAFNPSGKEVPVVTVPLGEVKVCAPKPADPSAGAAPVCEPFLSLPKQTSFKTGTGSTCWYYDIWGRIHYYWCP